MSTGPKQSLSIRRWVTRIGLAACAPVAVGSYMVLSYDFQAGYFGAIGRGERNTEMITTTPMAVGPYAQRVDYAHIPERAAAAIKKGWDVTPQKPRARQTVLGMELYPQYTKKEQAGFFVVDSMDRPIHYRPYPAVVFLDKDAVADPIWRTICFIEDRAICDSDLPDNYNPAFNLKRTGKSVLQSLKIVGGDPSLSTLQTQAIKYEDGYRGQTLSPDTGRKSHLEKFRQIATASRDAYTHGTDTRGEREYIIAHYLNSAPYAAGRNGEVHGLLDAFREWFGRDFHDVNRILHQDPDTVDDSGLKEMALAFRQLLTLHLSLKMGSSYVSSPFSFATLQKRVDDYIPVLHREGVVSSVRLTRAMAGTKIEYTDLVPKQPKPEKSAKTANRIRDKAVNSVRNEAAHVVDYPHGRHEQDKTDVKVSTTLDGQALAELREMFSSFYDPVKARALGISGNDKLANPALLTDIIFSMVFYKAGKDYNDKLFQIDTHPDELDISDGTQLQLGSTMKPLFIEAALRGSVYKQHKKYAGYSPEALEAELAKPRGPFTKWLLQHLLAPYTDKTMDGTLLAFMQRTYSNNPNEVFFTAGGVHRFQNYRREDNGEVATLQKALEKSYNLIFIRFLADFIKEAQAEEMGKDESIFKDPRDPRRMPYVIQNGHTEGLLHLSGFWHKVKGKTINEALHVLAHSTKKGGYKAETQKTPSQLAIIFRTVKPGASLEEFESFIRGETSKVTPKTDFKKLYETYSPAKFSIDSKKDHLSLTDRGWVTGLNELVLVALAHQAGTDTGQTLSALESESKLAVISSQRRAEISEEMARLRGKLWDRPAWNNLVENTSAERIAAASWLINPRVKIDKGTGEASIRQGIKKAQDKAIRIELERQAFIEHIHPLLAAAGYPFPADNPSLAWILGSAGNTTAALSKFAGYQQNDGLEKPTRTITLMEYAKGIDTFSRDFTPPLPKPQQVIPVEVATLMRRMLSGVAERGTFKSIQASLDKALAVTGVTPVVTAENPTALRFTIGGKTGTSRNEKHTFNKNGTVKTSQSKSLTATAMIMVTDNRTGERYFGTVMAYVDGPKSARHHFSSALAMSIFNAAAPIVVGSINRSSGIGHVRSVSLPPPTVFSNPYSRKAAALREVFGKPPIPMIAVRHDPPYASILHDELPSLTAVDTAVRQALSGYKRHPSLHEEFSSARSCIRIPCLTAGRNDRDSASNAIKLQLH